MTRTSLLVFAILAVSAVASAKSYSVTLFQKSIIVRIPGDGDQRSELMSITIPK